MATLSGVWKWKDDISAISDYTRIPIPFRSNGRKFYGLVALPSNTNGLIYSPVQDMGSEGTFPSAVFNGPQPYKWEAGWEDIANEYRYIDFGAWPTELTDTFYEWFTSLMVYEKESDWKPIYQASVASGTWNLKEGYQYLNNTWVKISPIFREYNVVISTSTLDVDGIGKTIIGEDSQNTYVFSVNSDIVGTLPPSVVVTNATIDSYDQTTGKLIIGHAIGEVTIAAEAIT